MATERAVGTRRNKAAVLAPRSTGRVEQSCCIVQTDPPAAVRPHLPPHAQDIYREAFNSA